jgi:hypothetical protein
MNYAEMEVMLRFSQLLSAASCSITTSADIFLAHLLLTFLL